MKKSRDFLPVFSLFGPHFYVTISVNGGFSWLHHWSVEEDLKRDSFRRQLIIKSSHASGEAANRRVQATFCADCASFESVARFQKLFYVDVGHGVLSSGDQPPRIGCVWLLFFDYLV